MNHVVVNAMSVLFALRKERIQCLIILLSTKIAYRYWNPIEYCRCMSILCCPPPLSQKWSHVVHKISEQPPKPPKFWNWIRWVASGVVLMWDGKQLETGPKQSSQEGMNCLISRWHVIDLVTQFIITFQHLLTIYFVFLTLDKERPFECTS